MIKRFEVRNSGANVAVLEDVRRSDRSPLHVNGAVGLPSARRHVVASETLEKVGMNGDGTVAAFNPDRTFVAVVHTGEGAANLAAKTLGRIWGWYAVVLYADHTANRLGAPAQGRGATNDFDALGRQRVNWHAMVFADVGHVHRTDAVLLNADARVINTSDNWSVRARSKAASRNAGRRHREVANVGGRLTLQLICRDDRNRREHVGGNRPQIRTGGALLGAAGRSIRLPLRQDRTRRGHGKLGEQRLSHCWRAKNARRNHSHSKPCHFGKANWSKKPTSVKAILHAAHHLRYVIL